MIELLHDALELLPAILCGYIVGRGASRRLSLSIARDDVSSTIDAAITHWRAVRDARGPRADVAPAYIDAAQSIRVSLLGALLPEPDPPTLGRDARTGDPVRPVAPPPGDTSTPARARLNRIAPACFDCGAEVGEPCRRARACVDRRVKGTA